ncbi:MAG: ABC transporter substrate-binding protein [Thermomicrobium sp.]|nr:ABC transporter substrate-binding protein [Thermomicrobium sp.]
MTIRRVTRRHFLWVTAGAASVAASALLAACGGSQATPTPVPASPTPAAPAATPTAAPAATPTAPPATPTAAPTPAASPTVLQARKLKMRVALATEEAGNFIAAEKGFFKEVGLDVELVTTQGTPGEVIPLLAVGDLHLFSGAIVAALVNAKLQGIDVTIVAGEGALRRGNVYHAYAVRKELYDQGVRTVADLRGRSLAMPSDAGIDLLELKTVLESGGLTLDDIKMQLIRLPDMPAALQNGAVEAAELVEPYATIATKQLGAAVPIVSGDALIDIIGDNFPISVIVAGPPMVKDRPLLEAFLVGYLKGARYYLQALKDPNIRAEVVQILKNRTPLKDEALYEQMTWPGVSETGKFDVSKLTDAQQLWQQRGKIQRTVPVEQLVDFSFVENAAKQL